MVRVLEVQKRFHIHPKQVYALREHVKVL